MKSFFLSLIVLYSSAALAAPNLDAMLSSIKADIAASRLSSPAGNNALERIHAFRQAAPYDFRILPLAYAWGEANVRLANAAIDNKDFDKAQDYLDKVWQLAALTPGLEEVQDKLDRLSDGKQTAAKPSKEELERQQKLAAAAEKEKARVDAEQKRKQEADAKRLAAEKVKAEEDKLRKQEAERQRRAELEAAKKAEPVKAASKVEPAKPLTKVEAPKVAPAPVVVAAAPTLPAVASKDEAEDDADIPKDWQNLAETSKAIASFMLPAKQLEAKDRAITATLEPICKAIVKDNASVVVHTADSGDYRWLTVRLTLCLRHIDKEFRLRHSHQNDLKDGQPYISLHPSRDASLLKEVTE